jgi:hypothetical protein
MCINTHTHTIRYEVLPVFLPAYLSSHPETKKLNIRRVGSRDEKATYMKLLLRCPPLLEIMKNKFMRKPFLFFWISKGELKKPLSENLFFFFLETNGKRRNLEWKILIPS